MVWVLVGALGIFIAGDLGLSPAQKGLMVAGPAFGGALFRILLGFLADRYGPKKVGMVSLAAVLIPLTWGWLGGNTFHELLGVGMLLGIAGASFAVAMPLASRSYPKEHQGVAMGIAGAGNSGTVIAALVAPRLAQHFGWHAVFGLAMIPVLLILILFVFLAREAPDLPQADTLQQMLRVLREGDLWRFSLFYSLTFGGFVGLAGFLAIYLHDQYGTPPVLAGTLTALCVFAGSFFRPLGGYLADRIGGTTLLFCVLPVVEVALVGVSFSPYLWLTVNLVFVAMMALGAGNGAVFQLVPDRFHKEIGVVSGIVGAAGGVGGSLLSLLLGSAKELTGSYHAGLTVFIAAMHVSLYPLLRYHRSRQQRTAVQTANALPTLTGQPVTMEVALPDSGWDGVRVRMELAFPGNPTT
ncbi:MAG: NarK/NasA family nitrate transporter [Acidobacteria bacterium]|nr:NarK/NasA family nitrate transporter [Acidobacteriota bacterium]